MNGIHDLGGMEGVGEIEVEADEPVFHAEWEKRVFGLFFGLAPHGFFNLDEFRLLTECGAISAEELEQRCREIAKGAK